MINTLLLVAGFIACITIITKILWDKAAFSWLSTICTLLVISFPFERIPSLSVGGATLKINQIIVSAGLYVLGILWLKRDPELLKHRFHWSWMAIVTFFAVSLPSILVIINWQRFAISYVGAIFVFGALFLLSNFAKNMAMQIRNLLIVMIGVNLFAVYQFLADMIGIPTKFTGLRLTYTKIVFGFPRVHATALEPLLYAGMLFVPLMILIVSLCTETYFLCKTKREIRIFNKAITFSPFTQNFLLFVFFLTIFILTISKSAYLAIVLAAPIILGILLFKKYDVRKFLTITIIIISVGAVVLSGLSLIVPKVGKIFQGVVGNFTTSLSGSSASAAERDMFLDAGFFILPKNSLVGVGAGQYGSNVPFLGANSSTLIVNNAYVEVWLEYGLLAALVFVLFILAITITTLKTIRKLPRSPQLTYTMILFFALLCYCIQWYTFSPLYIMPIFILFGLLLNTTAQISNKK